MARLRKADVDTTLAMRVLPRSVKNELAGWTGDTLKLRVVAPPVDGAANRACLSFLSELLDVALSHLAVVKGQHSRNKIVRITGLSKACVLARLGRPPCG